MTPIEATSSSYVSSTYYHFRSSCSATTFCSCRNYLLKENITSTFPLTTLNLVGLAMFFNLNKCKKEKTRGEYIYRTCRVINRINEQIQFANHVGLKSRIVNLMWKFVDNGFSDSNLCTWQLCCDFYDCRNIWTSF